MEDIVLEGQSLRLEPMRIDHLDALYEAGRFEPLWRWTTAVMESRDDMRRYVEQALRERAEEKSHPFVQVECASGRVIGSTRYGNIEPAHRKLEIGWTWLSPAWQRTAINTESKYLLLRHAFEERGCLRVELKTDALNSQSRNAMRRIGCIEEGTLRSHMLTETGRVRDSVYYSILASEWPAVKAGLEQKLTR